MLDFFKDLYLEVNGFDMDKVKEERKEKLTREKAETFVFKKQTKKYLLVACIVFLLISGLGLYVSIGQSVMGIVKNLLLILIDMVTMICMMIHKKETETVSLIGMISIVLITFVFPV